MQIVSTSRTRSLQKAPGPYMHGKYYKGFPVGASGFTPPLTGGAHTIYLRVRSSPEIVGNRKDRRTVTPLRAPIGTRRLSVCLESEMDGIDDAPSGDC